jgi:protocatechuate 3,4-dioxygenase beta subunit
MLDNNEFTLTETVLAQMEGTKNPRLKEVMACAVRHLHAFAQDIKLMPEEWLTGIKFITAVGQASTALRQETILLSDVLGLSAMVNALHDDGRADASSESSLLGPFFREGAPLLPAGAQIVQHHTGPEIVVYGRISDDMGAPIENASIEVWQTDETGHYDLQSNHDESMDMRGSFRTDAEGRYYFRTVRPVGYSVPLDGPVGQLVHLQSRHGSRPAHIHFLIAAEGYRELVTALYFANDAYIDSDTVFGVSKSLIVEEKNDASSPYPTLMAVNYDFKLGRNAKGDSGRVGADASVLMKAI